MRLIWSVSWKIVLGSYWAMKAYQRLGVPSRMIT